MALSRYKKSVFAAIITFVAFLLLEGILRLVDFKEKVAQPILTDIELMLEEPTPYKWDDALIYSFIPGHEWIGPEDNIEYRINNIGLRGSDIYTKKENELRVLCLGDSSTFGLGVAVDQTFCAVLASRLQKPV